MRNFIVTLVDSTVMLVNAFNMKEAVEKVEAFGGKAVKVTEK